MKANAAAVLMVLLLGGNVAFSRGTTSMSEAATHVSVEVMPYIAVSGPALITIGLENSSATSLIPAQIEFLVRANTQTVDLHVACTDLYQAGDPTSPYRIPVTGPGARLTCENGGPVGGGTDMLPWWPMPPASLLPSGWTGAVSEIGTFGTATAAVFSQTVTVEVAWGITDPTVPAGEYRGFVTLIGMVRP